VVLVLGDEASPADALLDGLIIVVLDGVSPAAVELAALRWLGEHADEIGAHAEHLLIAGGARAARLAVDARDAGGPELERQLLIGPRFGSRQPMPTDVARVAAATVLAESGAPGEDARRYAARLRGAGVPVREVRR
jgi:acetyl esterase/lipase